MSALVEAVGYGEEEEGFGDVEAAVAFMLQVILHLVRSLDAWGRILVSDAYTICGAYHVYIGHV